MPASNIEHRSHKFSKFDSCLADNFGKIFSYHLLLEKENKLFEVSSVIAKSYQKLQNRKKIQTKPFMIAPLSILIDLEKIPTTLLSQIRCSRV